MNSNEVGVMKHGVVMKHDEQQQSKRNIETQEAMKHREE
jgi:hypothetical protein